MVSFTSGDPQLLTTTFGPSDCQIPKDVKFVLRVRPIPWGAVGILTVFSKTGLGREPQTYQSQGRHSTARPLTPERSPALSASQQIGWSISTTPCSSRKASTFQMQVLQPGDVFLFKKYWDTKCGYTHIYPALHQSCTNSPPLVI